MGPRCGHGTPSLAGWAFRPGLTSPSRLPPAARLKREHAGAPGAAWAGFATATGAAGWTAAVLPGDWWRRPRHFPAWPDRDNGHLGAEARVDFPEKKAKAGHAPGGYSRGAGRLDGGPWRGCWVSVGPLAAAAPLLPNPKSPSTRGSPLSGGSKVLEPTKGAIVRV